MYGDTNRGGATTALRFVTCDLSSLTDCDCVSSAESDFSGSSSKRKNRSKPSPLIDPDSLTPLTAKRLILERPSLIDRLIYQNKSALEEMEGKKRGPKRGPASKLDEKENKRKRTESMNGTSPAIKRLRSSKGGSDSESSESRNTSTERRGRPLSTDKGINKKSSPKKMLKKSEKSRFSKRIVFSTSSLRSGKKRKEFMKRKRIVKSLTRESKEKKKWVGNDKTDSNSNVCTENDSNDEGVDDSTDSEMSRGTLEPSELIATKHEPLKCQEDVKKRKKRRKRDSMWVKKVKRQIKAKAEVVVLPPALSAEIADKIDVKDEEYESSDALDESDIPVLNKESDDSLNLSNVKEPIILNNVVPDDVSMPKLEKEVEIETPIENNQGDSTHEKQDVVENVTVPYLEEKPCEVESISENEIQPTVSVDEKIVPQQPPDQDFSSTKSLESNQEDELGRHETNQIALESNENATENGENINENIQTSLFDVGEKNIETNPQDSPKECISDCDKAVEGVNREPDEEFCDRKPIIIKSITCEYLPCPKIEKIDEYNPVTLENVKEEVLELEPNMLEENAEQMTGKELVGDPRDEETDITKSDNLNPDQLEGYCNKTEPDINDTLHKVPHMAMDSSLDTKEVSLLDADSTSDVKPQNLDDSFTDFSLRLPDDLELDSSQSEEDRDEESDGVFPDSTGNGQHEESSSEVHDIPHNDNIINNDSSSLINVKPQEAHKETREDMSKETNSSLETMQSDISVKLSSNEDNTHKVSDPVSQVLQKNVESIEAKSEELTSEQRQMKESVLQALGLKSLTTQQPEEKPKRDGYTGTLKAVIKLSRSGDKKRMVYQRTEDSLGELEYRICSEIPSTDGVPITHLNDISGIRKNVAKLHQESDLNHGTATSNGDSEEHYSSNHDDTKGLSGAKESNLIIPEKSSSFSIHPARLCSDVCSYCFGKFGCLDTPCHVAQLKPERQKKILESEPHLTAESCLCDACYRYVDRKACPTKSSGNGTKTRVKPPASSQCCVNLCGQQATHTVKKKWLVKLKKSITNKLDIDLDKPGAMYYPLCAQHHYWVDYFTVCGICRKRLNRNHLYSLGSETDRLNLMLAEDGIPARLSDKLFLCKLCRYYSNLRLKYSDPGSIPSSGQIFYRDYRRKILMSLDIPVSDSEDEHAVKEDKKKGNSSKKNMAESNGNSIGAASSNKSEESVMSLSNLATLLGEQPEQQARIQVKFGNVNIGRLSNLNIGQGGRDREERLPYSDVGLQANLEFQGPAVPDGSWERCVSTIQFDKRTKKLWQDLQKPYGNQSSFLRHLVMLEKYWRAGYLTLTPGSDERATKYLNGVKNRIKAFEGSSEKPVPTQSTVPVNNSEKFPLITNTGEIEVTPIKTVQKKPNPPAQPEKKHLTPLDRAKALVRMVPPTQRFPMPIQRYPVPMYSVPSYSYSPQHRPPPLLKIRNKPPHQYYHQISQSMPSATVLRPILPKLPKALTVTQVPQSGPTITLNRSGITIEKQSGSPVTPSLPIEKPSISVFREPAPGPS